jgi:hypothetical protein
MHMDKQQAPNNADTMKKNATKQPCPDDFKQPAELDGKNDSGPDPEVHRDAPTRD